MDIYRRKTEGWVEVSIRAKEKFTWPDMIKPMYYILVTRNIFAMDQRSIIGLLASEPIIGVW